MVAALVAACITSCNTARYLPDNGYTLYKNRVNVDNPALSSDALGGVLVQKTHRKGRFLNLGPWLYLRNATKENWIKRNLGVEPTMLDTSLYGRSADKLMLYCQNEGFFNASVSWRTQLKERRRHATAIFDVKAGKAYRVRQYHMHVGDTVIARLLSTVEQDKIIKREQRYRVERMEKERERISKMLLDNGYYGFLRQYIYFEVDSALNTHHVDIHLYLSGPGILQTGNYDSIGQHPRYRFNEILLQPAPGYVQGQPYDTVVKYPQRHKQVDSLRPIFIADGHDPAVRHRVLMRSNFINKGDWYSAARMQQTYNRLTQMPIIASANMALHPLEQDTAYLLNCTMKLRNSMLNSYTVATEGTNEGGRMSVGGNITFNNRNLFRGAEVLRVKVGGAVDVQSNIEGKQNRLPWEAYFETALDIPRLVLPINQRRYNRLSAPKTSVIAGVSYQDRPHNFERYIVNIKLGYDWQSTRTIRHYFSPIAFNTIHINTSREFEQYLQSMSDPRYRNQYTNHLIASSSYTFTFSNQGIRKNHDFQYVRMRFEPAGNLLNGYNNLTHAIKDEEGRYQILDINYAQYVRFDGDFRYFMVLDPRRTLAIRTFVGLGIPYGNSTSMPFEKGFYAGGANSLRGWPIRLLGPGTFNSDDLRFDRMGDIGLEANVEYRFPFYQFLEGALFTDVGNIWLRNENTDFPGGEFHYDTFYRQLAVDGGLGLRFDFDFFLFRIDAAVPLRKPHLDKKWIDPGKFQFADIQFNLGIGYPF